ncbi:MAG: hypothetical protein ACYC2P_09300 [Paludibacteraceae bacterium]
MDEKNTREINLLDMLFAIWKWLVRCVRIFLNAVVKILRLIFRHKILTVALMLSAVIISQYLARSSNKQYNVDAMVVLHGVQAQTVMQIGSQLTSSSSRFKETSLARKLGLQDSVAKKISSILFFDVIDFHKDSVPDLVDFKRNHSNSDTVNVKMKDHVYIRFKIKGTNHAGEISNAILNYINKNTIVHADFETLINIYKQRIKLIDVESKRIDSLARKKYFEDEKTQIRLQNNQLLVGNQQKQLFYGDLLALQKYRSEAETKIAEAPAPAVVPSGFIINPQPVNGRVKYGVYGLVIGLCIALLLSVLIENLGKILEFLNKR